MVEPERAFMDEKDVEWRPQWPRHATACHGHGGHRSFLLVLKLSGRITRFGGPPDYTIANLYYLKADLKTTSLDLFSLRIFENCRMFRSRFSS